MPRILHLQASPRRASASSELAAAFLADIAALAPGATVDTLDVWAEALPAFDGDAIDAKYARLGGRDMTPGQATAWDEIARMVARLDAADAVLVSTPMWNLHLPYRLKHWIDLVTQPGLSFSFDPSTGYTPLLRPRPLAVLLASSGDFADGTSYGRPDLASDYVATAFGFIGLTGATIVPLGPTAGRPGAILAGRDRARHQLAGLAPAFAAALR